MPRLPRHRRTLDDPPLGARTSTLTGERPMTLSTEPIARAQMLIRRPVSEVFEAFVDPALTSRFWFTRGSGRLEPGASVNWHWEMYGVGADVVVRALEPGRRILIEWPNPVEWVFSPRGDDATFVTITESGFTGTVDEKVALAIDSMGGFTLVLAGCKAFLEHGIELNLVADHNPDATPSAPDCEGGSPRAFAESLEAIRGAGGEVTQGPVDFQGRRGADHAGS